MPIGIVRTANGWRTWVRIHHGPDGLPSKTWPRDTSIKRMKEWRENTRVKARLGEALAPTAGTFREDVRSYLTRIQTMPTLQWRRDDLDRWLRALASGRRAGRTRASITAGEVRAQLETWRAEGYAANTCNHRRTALMHLFTVLDGKSATNPIKDVPKYRDDSQDAPPRALSDIAVALLLDGLRSGRAEPDTVARMELFRTTGWPPAQMKQIAPTDVRWDDAVRLSPRRKGKGSAGVWLPLLPEAWAAMRAFKACGAWGEFHTSTLRNAFRRTAAKVRETIMLPLAIWQELEDVTPYQLRHSFLTMVANASRDDRAVKTLGQHSDIRTSHRYTETTADPRAVAALLKVTHGSHM